MKKFLLGICFGGIVAGSIGNYATLQYAQQAERQREQITAMGNEIAHLEFTNKQLMNENSYLSEQVK